MRRRRAGDVGPFDCPADHRVNLDPTFFDDSWRAGSALRAYSPQAYVLAHEYGHHVHTCPAPTEARGPRAGASSGSVRLELQADCYAGIWTRQRDHRSATSGGQLSIADLDPATT